MDVMKAYYNKNKLEADAVAGDRHRIFQECEKIGKVKIAEYAKEIENSICNISRIIIDKDEKQN